MCTYTHQVGVIWVALTERVRCLPDMGLSIVKHVLCKGKISSKELQGYTSSCTGVLMFLFCYVSSIEAEFTSSTYTRNVLAGPAITKIEVSTNKSLVTQGTKPS